MNALFRRKRSRSGRHAVPAGIRCYAIGDVHGCLDALDRLIDRIVADIGRGGVSARLVFLGDLVDRGPDSKGVLDRLIGGEIPVTKVDTIMGNHEEAMLGAYDGTNDPRGWLSYGGIQTLESYGIDRAERFAPGFDLRQRMREAVPAEHIAFLRSLPDQLRVGDYLFVHAGIRPGVAFDHQQPADLRWIREGFLDSEADHGAMIVHGHTISPEPQQLANRIGIDTGCYAGGSLTALVLEGSQQRFLQVPGLAA